MSNRPTVVVSGSLLHPVLEVTFPYGDEVSDAWVRSQPERRWNPERKCWTVTALGDDGIPSSFDIVDWDDQPGDIAPLLRPIATPSDHDTYTITIHPRLWGRDRVRARVGADAVWRDDTCLARPEDVSSDWCDNAPRRAATPPRLPSHRPLRFDGTIDGLRGVPLVDLDTVSPDVSASMYATGITNTYDLLHTVPRRYIDMSNPVPVADSIPGEKVAIVGTVTKVDKPTYKGGMGKATIVDAFGTKLYCRWFNAGWAVRRLSQGAKVLVFGTMESFSTDFVPNGHAMTNPLLESIPNEDARAVIGIYPASAKHDLTTWQVYRAANEAVSRIGELRDTVPAAFLVAHGLVDRMTAFRFVHDPADLPQSRAGRDRLAYDELLRLQLALLVARAQQGSERGIAYNGDGHLVAQYLARFPYQLTGDQQRAIDDILRDGASPHAGQRLLQGDVGSGKSLVSFIGMLNAVEAGHQAAMVAPTEILATQHYDELHRSVDGITHHDGSSVRVELLTNKVTGKRRKDVLAGLADGSVDMVVGTQALFADAVVFESLAHVVVDEQHRFGVEQRNALKAKGSQGRLPDLIYASATPIPRTAAMTVFGDLDNSIIAEMPPGRTPVATALHEVAPLGDTHHPVWQHVRSEVAAGRQAFVVCPLVGDSATKEAEAAVNTAEYLRAGALVGLRIGVVTGKQKAEERAATMDEFARGKLDVLVATTVIEVGVNVPNATVMVVLGADKFGIAQLHQLRGRVGRGKHPGTCYLVAQPRTKVGEQRLEALVSTTNGFELAELDLHIRGAGTLLGAGQSGTARDMRVADILNDVELVAWAKADARALVDGDPKMDRSPELRTEILRALGPDASEWLANS